MPCPFNPLAMSYGDPVLCPLCGEKINPGQPHPTFAPITSFDEYESTREESLALLEEEEARTLTGEETAHLLAMIQRVNQYEIDHDWTDQPYITLLDVYRHFVQTGKVFPVSSEASLLFIVQETAEASEALAARYAYKRNNPQNKPATFDAQHYAEELGDVILMALISGALEGVDPIQAMRHKMQRQMEAYHAKTASVQTQPASL